MSPARTGFLSDNPNYASTSRADQDGHYKEGSQPQVVRVAKSRGVHIILGLFFGLLGVHNF